MKRPGIVGSGQLAVMLAEAAAAMGLNLALQASSASDPACKLVDEVVIGAAPDGAATTQLAEHCDAIGFENEWVDLKTIAQLEERGLEFQPSAAVLQQLVDKRSQHLLLERLNLPCPRWCDLAEVVSAGGALPEHMELPAMAKAMTGGYDGQGTERVLNRASLEALLMRVDPRRWILEELVPFEHELAVVVARDAAGQVELMPLVETHQHQQVCEWVLAPAGVSHAVEARVRSIAVSLVTALDYVGVLAIEMFLGPQGLLINELAPRTHNSGHFSIEACSTSQFQQQLRLLSGEPPAAVEWLASGAFMVNLLGFETSDCPYSDRLQQLERLPGAHVHWYGKEQSRPGRKLGHITFLLQAKDPGLRRREAMERLQEVREHWPAPGQTP
ncbi:MAG: 5-(carboxyamino)imidazole ribonucleotide synthase [Prochlorococcaceae cyanobacterium]|nr:5-(carboxyamino)imidazole ribonucleotide synthase [Synechococcus sp.]